MNDFVTAAIEEICYEDDANGTLFSIVSSRIHERPPHARKGLPDVTDKACLFMLFRNLIKSLDVQLYSVGIGDSAAGGSATSGGNAPGGNAASSSSAGGKKKAKAEAKAKAKSGATVGRDAPAAGDGGRITASDVLKLVLKKVQGCSKGSSIKGNPETCLTIGAVTNLEEFQYDFFDDIVRFNVSEEFRLKHLLGAQHVGFLDVGGSGGAPSNGNPGGAGASGRATASSSGAAGGDPDVSNQKGALRQVISIVTKARYEGVSGPEIAKLMALKASEIDHTRRKLVDIGVLVSTPLTRRNARTVAQSKLSQSNLFFLWRFYSTDDGGWSQDWFNSPEDNNNNNRDLKSWTELQILALLRSSPAKIMLEDDVFVILRARLTSHGYARRGFATAYKSVRSTLIRERHMNSVDVPDTRKPGQSRQALQYTPSAASNIRSSIRSQGSNTGDSKSRMSMFGGELEAAFPTRDPNPREDETNTGADFSNGAMLALPLCQQALLIIAAKKNDGIPMFEIENILALRQKDGQNVMNNLEKIGLVQKLLESIGKFHSNRYFPGRRPALTNASAVSKPKDSERTGPRKNLTTESRALQIIEYFAHPSRKVATYKHVCSVIHPPPSTMKTFRMIFELAQSKEPLLSWGSIKRRGAFVEGEEGHIIVPPKVAGAPPIVRVTSATANRVTSANANKLNNATAGTAVNTVDAGGFPGPNNPTNWDQLGQFIHFVYRKDRCTEEEARQIMVMEINDGAMNNTAVVGKRVGLSRSVPNVYDEDIEIPQDIINSITKKTRVSNVKVRKFSQPVQAFYGFIRPNMVRLYVFHKYLVERARSKYTTPSTSPFVKGFEISSSGAAIGGTATMMSTGNVMLQHLKNQQTLNQQTLSSKLADAENTPKRWLLTLHEILDDMELMLYLQVIGVGMPCSYVENYLRGFQVEGSKPTTEVSSSLMKSEATIDGRDTRTPVMYSIKVKDIPIMHSTAMQNRYLKRDFNSVKQLMVSLQKLGAVKYIPSNNTSTIPQYEIFSNVKLTDFTVESGGGTKISAAFRAPDDVSSKEASIRKIMYVGDELPRGGNTDGTLLEVFPDLKDDHEPDAVAAPSTVAVATSSDLVLVSMQNTSGHSTPNHLANVQNLQQNTASRTSPLQSNETLWKTVTERKLVQETEDRMGKASIDHKLVQHNLIHGLYPFEEFNFGGESTQPALESWRKYWRNLRGICMRWIDANAIVKSPYQANNRVHISKSGTSGAAEGTADSSRAADSGTAESTLDDASPLGTVTQKDDDENDLDDLDDEDDEDDDDENSEAPSKAVSSVGEKKLEKKFRGDPKKLAAAKHVKSISYPLSGLTWAFRVGEWNAAELKLTNTQRNILEVYLDELFSRRDGNLEPLSHSSPEIQEMAEASRLDTEQVLNYVDRRNHTVKVKTSFKKVIGIRFRCHICAQKAAEEERAWASAKEASSVAISTANAGEAQGKKPKAAAIKAVSFSPGVKTRNIDMTGTSSEFLNDIRYDKSAPILDAEEDNGDNKSKSVERSSNRDPTSSALYSFATKRSVEEHYLKVHNKPLPADEKLYTLPETLERRKQKITIPPSKEIRRRRRRSKQQVEEEEEKSAFVPTARGGVEDAKEIHRRLASSEWHRLYYLAGRLSNVSTVAQHSVFKKSYMAAGQVENQIGKLPHHDSPIWHVLSKMVQMSQLQVRAAIGVCPCAKNDRMPASRSRYIPIPRTASTTVVTASAALYMKAIVLATTMENFSSLDARQAAILYGNAVIEGILDIWQQRCWISASKACEARQQNLSGPRPKWRINKRCSIQIYGRKFDFMKFITHFRYALSFNGESGMIDYDYDSHLLTGEHIECMSHALISTGTKVVERMAFPVDRSIIQQLPNMMKEEKLNGIKVNVDAMLAAMGKIVSTGKASNRKAKSAALAVECPGLANLTAPTLSRSGKSLSIGKTTSVGGASAKATPVGKTTSAGKAGKAASKNLGLSDAGLLEHAKTSERNDDNSLLPMDYFEKEKELELLEFLENPETESEEETKRKDEAAAAEEEDDEDDDDEDDESEADEEDVEEEEEDDEDDDEDDEDESSESKSEEEEEKPLKKQKTGKAVSVVAMKRQKRSDDTASPKVVVAKKAASSGVKAGGVKIASNKSRSKSADDSSKSGDDDDEIERDEWVPLSKRGKGVTLHLKATRYFPCPAALEYENAGFECNFLNDDEPQWIRHMEESCTRALLESTYKVGQGSGVGAPSSYSGVGTASVFTGIGGKLEKGSRIMAGTTKIHDTAEPFVPVDFVQRPRLRTLAPLTPHNLKKLVENSPKRRKLEKLAPKGKKVAPPACPVSPCSFRDCDVPEDSDMAEAGDENMAFNEEETKIGPEQTIKNSNESLAKRLIRIVRRGEEKTDVIDDELIDLEKLRLIVIFPIGTMERKTTTVIAVPSHIGKRYCQTRYAAVEGTAENAVVTAIPGTTAVGVKNPTTGAVESKKRKNDSSSSKDEVTNPKPLPQFRFIPGLRGRMATLYGAPPVNFKAIHQRAQEVRRLAMLDPAIEKENLNLDVLPLNRMPPSVFTRLDGGMNLQLLNALTWRLYTLLGKTPCMTGQQLAEQFPLFDASELIMLMDGYLYSFIKQSEGHYYVEDLHKLRIHFL